MIGIGLTVIGSDDSSSSDTETSSPVDSYDDETSNEAEAAEEPSEQTDSTDEDETSQDADVSDGADDAAVADGGGGAPAPGPAPEYAVLYLDFADLSGAGGVYYACDISGDGWTEVNGGFYFYPGEACTFDLTGFDGSGWTPLYIDYGDSTGVEGIYYECWYGSAGTTTWEGQFFYEADDSCSFWL